MLETKNLCLDHFIPKVITIFWLEMFVEKIQVTVGASFLSQTIALQDSTTVKFEIWDTAGQER